MAKAMNVVDAYNMQGGMTAWAEAGYDTEDPPADH
jgi:rhodanese-related sulfurtransferase